MSSKKESVLQGFAALLGILASGVALQDWYGKRTAGAEPVSAAASVGVYRLHPSGTDAKEPAAAPDAGTPAPAQPASAPPPAPAPPPTATPAAPAIVQRTPASPAPAAAVGAAPAATAPPPSAAPPAAPAASTGAFAALASAAADARAVAAVRGEGAARLLSGLEQRGMGAVRGGFAQSAPFEQMLGGNGSALGRSGALSSGRVLVGELQASYAEAEAGVAGCVLTLRYVVLDARGSRVARRMVAVEVTGNDRASALSEAVTELLRVHGATITGDAGG